MAAFQNFQDFALFLYIHVAHSDGQFQAAEESMVRQKLAGLFDQEEEREQKFAMLLDLYRSTPADALPALIRETFQHFSGVQFSAKYKVYTNLFDIINADGRVSSGETEALRQLRALMGSENEPLQA